MTDHPLRQRIADVLDLASRRTRDRVRRAVVLRGAGRHARPPDRVGGRRPRVRSGSCCATGPPMSPRSSACCWPAATVVVINPSRGDDRTNADIEALELPVIIGDADDLANAGRAGARLDGDIDLRVWTPTRGGRGRRTARRRQARRRGADADQRHDRTAEAHRPHLRHAGAQRDRAASRTGRRRRQNVRSGVAIVNAPLVHIGGVFRVLQCVAEARPFALLERFELRPLGRRGAQASAARGVAGARRTADGAALRSDPRGPRRASAPSHPAPRRCRPRTPTRSPRSSASRS